MSLKKNLLWILLFGSLIGLNETVVGALDIPYRSVLLSSVSIAILAIARFRMPVLGSSFLIIAVAIAYRVSCMGLSKCTVNELLCGPTALLMMGVCFEIFATVFIGKKPYQFQNYVLTCLFSSVFVFAVFALMQVYVLHLWGREKFVEYVFVKGPMTAVISAVVGVAVISLLKGVSKERKLKVSWIVPVVGVVVMWGIGYRFENLNI